MSLEVTKKSNKVRNVIVTLLLIVIAILTIGILTRPRTSISTQDNPNSLYQTLSDLTVQISELEKQLEEIKAIQSAQEDVLRDIQEQVTSESEPLEGAALYASYAEEITQTTYPDISADYVKAIIWHESRYQPEVVNGHTGVKGLMQINPKWHTGRAESLGVDDLFDPYGNILVGCDILNELTQQHDFNYALNFFAGGYPYADRYKDSASPFVQELNVIIHQMENGEILL